ncbi:MAG: hypothetical protein ACM3XM_15060 [Mycobacterium leprae]
MRSALSLTVTMTLLAGFTALLQLGPVWWPAGGYLLAAAAVVPVAIGTALRPRWSNRFLLLAAFIIGLVQVHQFVYFVTTTGPVGLVLGLTYGRPWYRTLAAVAIALALGLLLLSVLSGSF